MILAIIVWLFNEAQTSKGRLDTHFSFVNIKFRAFVEAGNDITTEADIYEALQHEGGIRGNTVMWLDGWKLNGPTIKKDPGPRTRSSGVTAW